MTRPRLSIFTLGGRFYDFHIDNFVDALSNISHRSAIALGSNKRVMMNLGSLDPALGCSGLMSIFSYDSHPVTRSRRGDTRGERVAPRLGASPAGL